MTKSVRIENADTSNHVLVADVFSGSLNPVELGPHETHFMRNPTDMKTLLVHSHQFIVLREATEDELKKLNDK